MVKCTHQCEASGIRLACAVCPQDRVLPYSGGWSPSSAGCLWRLLGLAFTSEARGGKKEKAINWQEATGDRAANAPTVLVNH